MNEPYETYKLPRGRTLEIHIDGDPQNPRTDWDGWLTKIFHWHKRYNVGDERIERPYNHEEYVQAIVNALKGMLYGVSSGYSELDNWENDLWAADNDGKDTSKIVKRGERLIAKYAFVQKLFMYEHSNIAISTGSFSDPWDSGQVGFIILTKKAFADNFSSTFKGRFTSKQVKRAYEVIDGEVEEFGDYVSGDVFGFIVKDKDGNDEESVWGYYGSDFRKNGLFDAALTKEEMRYLVRTRQVAPAKRRVKK